METLFCISLLISLACLLAGLIKPSLVLGFLKGDKTRKKVIFIFGALSILFFTLFSLVIQSDLIDKLPGSLKTDSEKEISPASQEEDSETSLKENSDGEEFAKESAKEPAGESKETQSETTLCSMSIGDVAKKELLQLDPWTDGAVSINLPSGWNVYTGGECATKSILARDPLSELKQVFYFSEAGPVYTTQERKTWDYNYMQMGGSGVSWFESPLVNPLTAENYLVNFGSLALTSFFQQAFPQVPIMTNIKIISSEKIADKPTHTTDVKLIRAEFQQNNKLGEGYFYIVTADIGMGWGYGMMFIGITAPKGLLDLITPSLKKSLDSYTISQGYINTCIQAQNKAAAGALEAGKILSETSDTIMDVWENKLESEQRMSEKYSDITLGNSRLYNSDTDEVYEVTPEFYDYYQVHDNEFEKNYLEELPDDKWSYVPLNGAEHIY